MEYLMCGILGIILGFFVFYLLGGNNSYTKARKRKRAAKRRNTEAKGSVETKGKQTATPKRKRKLPKPNFTKAVLVAVLSTYFVGVYIGIKVTILDYSQFGVLATYIATPTTTVIALYCWKAKAENIIKIKKGNPEETKDFSIDLNNIDV